MAVIHYHRPLSAGERDVDAAVMRAQARYHELELRLEAFDQRIASTRQLAKAAGIFNELVPVPAPNERREPRRVRRLALRGALARAALRDM